VREAAPDRRDFFLQDRRGEVRSIKGYRGDGSPLGRRALPVCDARLLVNLVASPHIQRPFFLDPFAGAGGILLEAQSSGYRVASLDIDPILRHGLSGYGALHCVANASRMPFQGESCDAIGTEPPYDPAALEVVIASIHEMHRVLKKGGRMAVLCAGGQAAEIHRCVSELDFAITLASAVDRKGTPVAVLAMQK
jgi:tRNA G10  N-methylase Trm11